MEELTKNLQSILILLLSVGMYSFYKKLKEYFENKYSKISSPNADNISLGVKTQGILQDIMKMYDCNRVMLLEFHNGDVFSSVAPNWKLSMTYELVDSHTVRLIDKLQNIRASLVIDLIAGCISHDFPAGVSYHSINCDCCGNNIIAIDVSEMDNTYAKGIFDFNNSKYVFVVPIKREGRMVGIVLVDYTENVLVDAINRNGCTLCNKVNEISAMWELYHKEAYKPKISKFVEFLRKLK